MPIKPVEDFTTQEKTDFRVAINAETSGAAAAAQAAAIQRSNHTGTQALSTISQSGATSGQVPAWNGSAWVADTRGGVLYASDYGVVGDGRYGSATTTADSAVITGAVFNGGFSASDVGKFIRIEGAGKQPTVSFTISGGVITSVTLTDPGSAGAYTPGAVFDLIITDAGWTPDGNHLKNCLIEATVAGDGSIASVSLLQGGYGYTSPTITFPRADLRTTIASVQSSSQATLTLPAKTAVTNAAAISGTDNSAAMQSAIDDAADHPLFRTIQLGAGIFIGNYQIKPRVGIRGVGTGTSGYLTSINEPTAKVAETVLQSSDVSIPVIWSIYAGLASIERVTIHGGASKKGIGVQVGRPRYEGQPGVRTGFVAQGFKMAYVNLNGFDTCVQMCRTADCVIEGVTPGYSVTGFFLGDYPLFGNADSTVFLTCAANYIDGTLFNTVSSKTVMVIGGDFNYCGNILYIGGGSVGFNQVNVENCTGEVFTQYTNSYLSVEYVKLLNCTGATVSVYGGGNQTTIHNGPGCTYRTTYANMTNSNFGNPTRLPYSSKIQVFSDTTWTTKIDERLANRVYNMQGKPRFEWSEGFTRNYTSSPCGEYGWTLTNIGGSYAVSKGGDKQSVGFSQKLGSSSTDVANLCRLMATDLQVWPSRFEYEFALSIPSPSTVRLRAGLYSNDGTVDFDPLNGIGIRVDRSTPDANIIFEVINNGTVTSVDTGIAHTRLSTATRFTISRSGDYSYPTLHIRDGATAQASNGEYGIPLAFSIHTASPPGAFLAPSFFLGTSATNWMEAQLRFARFRTYDY